MRGIRGPKVRKRSVIRMDNHEARRIIIIQENEKKRQMFDGKTHLWKCNKPLKQ